jgi:opacity protein-like surface antigen
MRALVIVCALLSLPLTAVAQETPKVELFGGYSYFRNEGGRDLHGWTGSIAVNLNHWFGLVADVSGHYESRTFRLTFPNGGFNVFDSSTGRHTVVVGPRFSYRKSKRLVPFAHVLLGITREHEDTTSLLPDFTLRTKSNNTGFAMALGGGLDVALSRRVALRLFQVDYSLTHVVFTRHNARGSVGLVFRFD